MKIIGIDVYLVQLSITKELTSRVCRPMKTRLPTSKMIEGLHTRFCAEVDHMHKNRRFALCATEKTRVIQIVRSIEKILGEPYKEVSQPIMLISGVCWSQD